MMGFTSEWFMSDTMIHGQSNLVTCILLFLAAMAFGAFVGSR